MFPVGSWSPSRLNTMGTVSDTTCTVRFFVGTGVEELSPHGQAETQFMLRHGLRRVAVLHAALARPQHQQAGLLRRHLPLHADRRMDVPAHRGVPGGRGRGQVRATRLALAACYRGTRVFDTQRTREVVKKWVDFYKLYRQILTSDIIHVRRGDMQSIDCFLHANPALEQRGLAMFFNPTDAAIKDVIELPLYYTGLTATARLAHKGGKLETLTLERDYSVQVSIGGRQQYYSLASI
ncbi:unnamed protein product [Sphagnum tenellum]